jgi:hypothetical protein
LNPNYFLDGVKYLQAEERRLAMPTLFDAFEMFEPSEDAA